MQEILHTFRPDLFSGRHALVVGATSGIGLDIARGFAGLGARVTATGSSAGKIAGLDEEGISFERLDVRDADAVRAFCAAQTRVDVLINAAGVARGEEEWQEEVFLDTIDVNLNAQMRFSFALHDRLAETRGSIVNIASMLSFLADPGVPAYCASKTGVLGLTRACAHRWGREGIRVNAIAPGYHKTDMTKPIWSRPKGEAAISKRTALGRWGTTEDLVGAALYLCSPAAAYITGICLEVDGGFATGNPLE
ncbi:SDR family NAD(P)-dependent oxidoreductase [Chelativorans sp. M5D2P16]|uniref:SDR family NAD(P)-dependent oxidoreductase n=1 Tax=Chelativorans sp. M5D2P16 TaxID=3095678 RepID=UPI002ACA1C66|nr:SDR family oxidoreductase [Chelativorans sp. M5D2P16]MDZ5696028.1 SDR family oxidoreductase [Chelativorans sp. M5D2P16]